MKSASLWHRSLYLKPRTSQEISQYFKTQFPDLSDVYGLKYNTNFLPVLLTISSTLQKSALGNVNPTLRYEFSNFGVSGQFWPIFSFLCQNYAKIAQLENSYLWNGLTFWKAVFCSIARTMSRFWVIFCRMFIHRHLRDREIGLWYIGSFLEKYEVSDKVTGVAEKRFSRAIFLCLICYLWLTM